MGIIINEPKKEYSQKYFNYSFNPNEKTLKIYGDFSSILDFDNSEDLPDFIEGILSISGDFKWKLYGSKVLFLYDFDPEDLDIIEDYTDSMGICRSILL